MKWISRLSMRAAILFAACCLLALVGVARAGDKAKAFKSIDAPTQGVIVPYVDGKVVIAELSAAFEVQKQFALLRRAQQYAVNVFPQVMKRLDRKSALHEVQEGTGILYLDSRYYDSEFGLSEDPVNLMELQNA